MDNLSLALVFNSVLGISMLALIPFWCYRAGSLNAPAFLKVAMVVCGTGFSLGIFGVALTPYNLLPKIHDISVYSAFALMVPGMVIMIIFSGRDFYPGRAKTVMLCGFAAALLIELGIQILVSRRILPSRPAFPVMQKVNIAIFLFWLYNELRLYRRFLGQAPEV